MRRHKRNSLLHWGHKMLSEMMPYVAAIIGFLAVFVLNAIKQDMRDIKTSLTSLERDMRDGVSSLDRRVTIIETRWLDAQ